MYINRACSPGCRNAGQPPKSETRNLRIAILRSFYSFACNYRILDADGKPTRLYADVNPLSSYKPLPRQIDPRGLTQEEIDLFFAAIRDMPDVPDLMRLRDRALFLFMLASCRRIGEVLALKVGDFVRETIEDERGQAHTGWLYYFTPSKKKTKVREKMELSGMVMAAIQSYWAARPALSDDLPAFARGVVDVSYNPYSPMKGHTISRRMKSYLAYAGLDEEISPHALRHSGAQFDYLNGSTVFDVSHKLRHSSLQITSRYLAKLRTPCDKSIDKFEAAFAHLAH